MQVSAEAPSLSCCLHLGCHPHGSLLCLLLPPLYSSLRFVPFSRNASTGCQCLCSPAGRCGLQAVMLFASTLWYPWHNPSLIPGQCAKGKKSRQPLCSSVPLRAFVKIEKITKALHSTSHIASPSSAISGILGLAPLLHSQAARKPTFTFLPTSPTKGSLRLAWSFVYYTTFHSLRPAVFGFPAFPT
ncbi:hypothetical protein SAMN04488029_3395 [Reichenbachiella faecimaris]|uniref:Uncharacterized protein n=1 Tax=Reichenbachiella faecimaris TaxID=692418 RepID=A0A1W2GMU0_REIFA|nr:hypothetical protein SAMN04488029_3395 [Reichenbachiella faecimaris]